MIMRFTYVLCFAVAFLSKPAFCQGSEVMFAPPPAGEILKTLKPGHPRLMIDDTTIPRIRTLIATDSVAAKCYRRVKRNADRTLERPPSEYRIPDGRRLLSVSRRVKERVRDLAFVYLMEGDRKYVDRAWAELEAASKFEDWNPSHFLDTAEMTHAFAVGYDWLYGEWTDAQRRVLREAIITHGLQPAMAVYKRDRGWHTGHNNWNQVCNGGIGTGALAVADEVPDLAAEILHNAIAHIPRAMAHYAPDGGGTEGVTYWSYGARYNVLFLSSLETALGTDFGLSEIDGLKQSGSYQIYMSGADRMAFNFADCGLSRMSAPMHFWLGKKYRVPLYAWFRYSSLQHPKGRGGLLDLLWFNDDSKRFDETSLPLDKHFRGARCASMRSAWGDPDALVLGIQAGDNENLGGHRHLDLGSFILEALGERWAIDSGTEKETYQRHRNKRKRWDFYRIRAEGHNTLALNPADGPDQNPRALARITAFQSGRDISLAVVDLTEAYSEHVRRAERSFEMVDRAYVTITDEVEAEAPIADLWWFMHTQADVALSEGGKAATLQQNGKQIVATIEAGPDGSAFEVMPAAPLPTSPNPDVQNKNEGRRKLAIHLTRVTDLKLTVKFMPVGGDSAE